MWFYHFNSLHLWMAFFSLNSCHLGSCNYQPLLISDDLGPYQLRSRFSIFAIDMSCIRSPLLGFWDLHQNHLFFQPQSPLLRAGKGGNLHATVVSISVFSLMQINYFRWDKKRADPLGFYRFASLMINFRRYLLHWCLMKVIKGFFTVINVQEGLLRICKKLKVGHIVLWLVVQRN